MGDLAVSQKVIDQFADPRWRLNNLYFITDKSGKRVKFEMNWAQDALFKDMHYQNVVLKARQLGFTTFIQMFILDQCVFNSNIRAGTIAHNLNDAQTIFRDKVKYPYDNLPEGIRNEVAAQKDTANELLLSNNSSVRVGTSLRSGTLQYLHISEYGKMCAKYPEKAREVRTGALNTVDRGQLVFIESTAEGQSGHFFEICQAAQQKQREATPLSEMDFKFFFFPWWKHSEYQMEPQGLVIEERFRKYFAELAQSGITLTDAQQAWYVRKWSSQKEDMKREYPSTPQEAFEASVEGAYFGAELTALEFKGRIMPVPWDSNYPVVTAWDLGIDDMTAIWFAQKIGLECRIIDYMEFRNVSLQACSTEVLRKPYRFSDHYMPHDAGTREMTTAKTRKESLESQGLKPIRVTANMPIADSINAGRNLLPKCVFDAASTLPGLRALRNFTKEWDEELGTFKNKPFHNWASHAASAFCTLALNFSEQHDSQAPKPWQAADYDPFNTHRQDTSGVNEYTPFS